MHDSRCYEIVIQIIAVLFDCMIKMLYINNLKKYIEVGTGIAKQSLGQGNTTTGKQP